jgi:uncharacterized membrane protein
MQPMTSSSIRKRVLFGFLLLLLVIISAVWIHFTPVTLDGKLRAIGFAVCHQIESHSLILDGKTLPLCARCTGMFLGTLIGLLFLYSNKKPAGFPSRSKIALLVLFLIAFIIDGVNSTLTFFPKFNSLYPPNNLLRLVTGLMMGVVLSNLLVPLWNQTIWKESNNKSALSSWKQFGLLLLVEGVVGAVIYLGVPFSFYPVAIISTGAIILMLGMIYILLWFILLKKENTLNSFRDGIPFYLVGLVTAFIQIGGLDLIRFWLTGTWQGFRL